MVEGFQWTHSWAEGRGNRIGLDSWVIEGSNGTVAEMCMKCICTGKCEKGIIALSDLYSGVKYNGLRRDPHYVALHALLCYFAFPCNPRPSIYSTPPVIEFEGILCNT